MSIKQSIAENPTRVSALAPARPTVWRRYRRLSPGVKILIFMALGVAAGVVFGERARIVQPAGDLFIRLLMMASLPLVFFNLLAGLTTMTELRTLGRVGGKIMLFYAFTGVAAMTFGIFIMRLVRPGVGMGLTGEVKDTYGQVPRLSDVLLNLVPENVFAAFSAGQVTQVVVFAIFLGVATLLLAEEQRAPLRRGFNLLAELLRKLVVMLLSLAPLGIGALAAGTVGQHGAKIFGPLVLFLVGVWSGHVAVFLLYMLLLYVFARRAPLRFLKQTGPLYATAAATCSSLASLVVALDLSEKALRIPRYIYSFTLPLGAQINKDGTAVMLVGVLFFTAQAAGVEFAPASYLTIVLMGLILTAGSAGIPGGGFVIALVFVKAFDLPLEIAVIVGGVYRLIDVGNTVINT
ncbi:MAG: dicarboxylate/amino acid:cation symporter, partial [Pyrinomonadaceae bacterium]